MAEADALAPEYGLQHLPHSVIALILHHVMSGGSGCGSSKAAPPGSAAAAGQPQALRSVVSLAFSCKALLQAVASAEPLWRAQCLRLGWSLDWLHALPPGTTAWHYFCRRMAVRHRLRRQLRTLTHFLDPVSAAAIRPGAAVEAVREAEAALQAPLPWELFELYRFCDGQQAQRGGAERFLDAARLLSLREMLQAAQDRQGPLATARAFQQLVLGSGGSGGGGASIYGSGTGGHGGGSSSAGGSSGAGGGAGGSTAACLPAGCAVLQGAAAWQGELGGGPPEVLLPFTDELRGRKRYCCDWSGRVWLSSGFNTLPAAPSLAALLHRILT